MIGGALQFGIWILVFIWSLELGTGICPTGINGLTLFFPAPSFAHRQIYGRANSRFADTARGRQGAAEERNRSHRAAPEADGRADDQAAFVAAYRRVACGGSRCRCSHCGPPGFRSRRCGHGPSSSSAVASVRHGSGQGTRHICRKAGRARSGESPDAAPRLETCVLGPHRRLARYRAGRCGHDHRHCRLGECASSGHGRLRLNQIT